MRRLILLGVLACRSDAPPPGVPAEAAPADATVADAPDPIRAAAVDGTAPPFGGADGRGQAPTVEGAEDTVTTALRELARTLADRKLTVAQLTAQLGSRTPARGRAVHVAPTDARFADAVIVRGPDRRPAQVKLELAQPVELGELRRAFGDYEVDARGQPLAAWPVAFVRVVRGRAASVSLFADVARGSAGSIDLQTTAHVTLQLAAP